MYYDYNKRLNVMEGNNDTKPSKMEILNHAHLKGYNLNNLEIYYDDFQSVWRWDADLVKHN